MTGASHQAALGPFKRGGRVFELQTMTRATYPRTQLPLLPHSQLVRSRVLHPSTSARGFRNPCLTTRCENNRTEHRADVGLGEMRWDECARWASGVKWDTMHEDLFPDQVWMTCDCWKRNLVEGERTKRWMMRDGGGTRKSRQYIYIFFTWIKVFLSK